MSLYDNIIYREDMEHLANLPLPWEKLKNSTVLITGASGLIGSVLVDSIIHRNSLYRDNIKILALVRNKGRAEKRFNRHSDNPALEIVPHDINNPLPNIGNADYIIHAASNTHPLAYASDPVGTITANVFGTYNLLEYAAKHKSKRFLFLSTVEIYGENIGDTEKFRENDMGYIDCNSLRAGYPESKRTGEALCNAFSARHDIDFVISRLCRIYGPAIHETDSKSTSDFIRNAASGRDIVLKSKGDQHYSCCYCADAVSAILYTLLLGKKGEAYNVAAEDSDVTLKKFAEILAKNAGVILKFELPTQLESQGFSKLTKALLDPSKLNALGWAAKDDIESGIGKTVEILHRRFVYEALQKSKKKVKSAGHKTIEHGGGIR